VILITNLRDIQPAGYAHPQQSRTQKSPALPLPRFIAFPRTWNQNMDRAGMLKVMHEVFGFVPVVMPRISAAGFLLLICLLGWRERGRAATAEIAKAQTMQTLASSTQTKEVNDIRAVFEESRLFTSARKERLIRDVNDFHQYLAQLGFDLPTDAPSLGVSHAGRCGWFAGGFPGTIYEEKTIYIPSEGMDNPEGITFAYAQYVFASIFHKFLHDPENHRLTAFRVFHHYYCASSANRKYKIDPNSKISNLENTLWDIRDLYGKQFMDRAMFYTLDRWESDIAKDANFETFFTARFLVGESVVDTGQQHEQIRKLLEERSLYYAADCSTETHGCG